MQSARILRTREISPCRRMDTSHVDNGLKSRVGKKNWLLNTYYEVNALSLSDWGIMNDLG